MRIGIIAPPWVPVPPLAYGGTEAVIDGLARGLVAAGHDVLLFTTGDSTCPVTRDWAIPAGYGVGTAGKAGPNASALELRHAVHAYEAIAAWDADIVHDHTMMGPLYATRLAPQRRPRIGADRIVTTNHSPFEGEVADYYRSISRNVALVAISHHQASTARATRIAAVIHHGVDGDAFPVGEGDGGYALFLGRVCAEKGIRTAIDVARAAGVPLKIAAKVAEPAEVDYFESHVRPVLGRDIEYLGEVGGREKADLLGGAMCLLNPIAWPEPFGMVMIEALACGTPVVATPCGAIPEIVADGTTGFIRRTPLALREALQDVGRLSRTACRAAAVGHFSIRRMAAEHVALYERIVSFDPGSLAPAS